MIQGKFVLIWKIQACEEGNIPAIIEKAQEMNVNALSVKGQDGAIIQNKALLYSLAQALEGTGIALDIWAFLYGSSNAYAKAEASTSLQLINDLHPRVFAFDVEWPYKRVGSVFWAQTYTGELIPFAPEPTKFAMMSYRYPSYHPEIPWNVFLDASDYHMPQVYWQGQHNPADQLDESYTQLIAKKDLPFYPVGSAYCEHGWCATVEDIEEFSQTAVDMDFSAYGFYSWDYASNNLPGVWEAISVAPVPGGVVIPPPSEPEPLFSVTVKSLGLNVRSGPGLNYPVLYANSQGKVLDVYNQVVNSDYTWIKISPDKKEWSALTKNSTVFAQ